MKSASRLILLGLVIAAFVGCTQPTSHKTHLALQLLGHGVSQNGRSIDVNMGDGGFPVFGDLLANFFGQGHGYVGPNSSGKEIQDPDNYSLNSASSLGATLGFLATPLVVGWYQAPGDSAPTETSTVLGNPIAITVTANSDGSATWTGTMSNAVDGSPIADLADDGHVSTFTVTLTSTGHFTLDQVIWIRLGFVLSPGNGIPGGEGHLLDGSVSGLYGHLHGEGDRTADGFAMSSVSANLVNFGISTNDQSGGNVTSYIRFDHSLEIKSFSNGAKVAVYGSTSKTKGDNGVYTGQYTIAETETALDTECESLTDSSTLWNVFGYFNPLGVSPISGCLCGGSSSTGVDDGTYAGAFADYQTFLSQ